jgi:hypothetical protein
VDGNELGEDILTLPFEGGTTHQITLVSPVSYTGTINFDSFDGAFNNEDYKYNFSFELMRQHYTGWNTDLDSFYWTLEGDDTRHYKVDSESTTDNYTYHVSVPIGSSVVLHNIPANVMFHQGASIPVSSVDQRASFSSGDNTKCITLNGVNVDPDAEGMDNDLFYELLRGIPDARVPQTDRYYIDTSGTFYSFGLGEGFDMTVYLMRSPEQFMFQKVYDVNENNVELDKLHHFTVALWDTMANKPFTNKVAYYVYDSLEDSVDEDEDVHYVTPNSDGIIDIYIKANQTVRVGRSISELAYDVAGIELRQSTTVSPVGYMVESFIPDSGELPYGIRYTISEVEDGYEATFEGDAKDVVLKNDLAYTYYNSRNSSGEVFREQLLSAGIEMPVFSNKRKPAGESVPETGDNVARFMFVLAASIVVAGIVTREGRRARI